MSTAELGMHENDVLVPCLMFLTQQTYLQPGILKHQQKQTT